METILQWDVQQALTCIGEMVKSLPRRVEDAIAAEGTTYILMAMGGGMGGQLLK